jgi:hypothetical protein
LLSLLLGFVLAMSLSRFDQRFQIVVDEANAVGTAMRRGDLLPEPARAPATALLREYAEARIAFAKAGLDDGALANAQARSDELAARLWAMATAAAEQDPRSTSLPLFVASLNQSFDLADARLASLEYRVPRELWVMLGVLSFVTLMLVGASLERRSLAAVITPALMFAGVALATADLDSPSRGLLRTSYAPLERLVR